MNHSLLWRFVAFFSAIACLVCGTTYWILRRRLGLSVTANRFLLGLFIFTAILMVVGPITYRFGNDAIQGPVQRAFQFLQYFLMGWVGCNFLVLLVLEIMQALSKPFDPLKRIFLTEGVVRGVVAATTLSTGLGLLEAQAGPRIEKIKIHLPNLPESFEGLTIAQISDVHIGPVLNSDFLSRVVDQVMSLNADIILITGDLVDGTVTQLKAQMEPLKRLRAKDGVYFCTGNHEFYSGVEEWIDYLESLQIHVFKNSNVLLERKLGSTAQQMLLAGVYDFQGEKFDSRFTTNPKLAATTAEPVDCKLLLAHNPFSIDEAAKAGFNFVFSGHTHAGQFYPFAFIVRLKLKHFEGLYRINEQTQLYVNRGTGYWGPPNRLGKRSEITHFQFSRTP